MCQTSLKTEQPQPAIVVGKGWPFLRAPIDGRRCPLEFSLQFGGWQWSGARKIFSRLLWSLQPGRTEIPNSLFTIMESFTFVAACFIHCFLSCFKFFPISNKPPLDFVIICLFSSSEVEQNGAFGPNGQRTDERQLACVSWRHWLSRKRKRLYTSTGTCQKQVCKESPNNPM